MSTIFQMPGYRIHEYRLVIPLSGPLQDRVQSLRKSLHEKHNIASGFELKPSLTVLKCHAFERMEPRLVERFQEVAMGHNPFPVELNGYAAYPSHTIYIDVPTKSPFVELVKGLKKARWLMNIPGHEPHFIPEPHLLVAQRLKPMQFIRMWMELEYSQFNGRFTADSMLLLRRCEKSKLWEVVRRMEFMSLPVNVKQGELFS